MAENEPSFGRLVVNRAWFGAWGFFESWRHDLVLFAVTLAVLGARFYARNGLPTDWLGVMDYIGVIIAPACLLWLALFIWHLWLAPSALVYESAKRAAQVPTAPPAIPAKQVPAVNWAVWKQRNDFTFAEFAGILAKVEPSSEPLQPETESFYRLIIDDAKGRRLKIHYRYGNHDFTETPDLYPGSFLVDKAVAIAWAEEKRFDVSHFV